MSSLGTCHPYRELGLNRIYIVRFQQRPPLERSGFIHLNSVYKTFWRIRCKSLGPTFSGTIFNLTLLWLEVKSLGKATGQVVLVVSLKLMMLAENWASLRWSTAIEGPQPLFQDL